MKKLLILSCLFFNFISVSLFADTRKEMNIDKQKLLVVTKDDFKLGDKDAKVILIEYSTFGCPHCADFHNESFKKLKENYIDKGLLLYVHRAFVTNQIAMMASMLAHCSNDNYFAMTDALFKSQNKWGYGSLENCKKELCNIAMLNGMDKEKFAQCIDDKDRKEELIRLNHQAFNKLEVKATPVFFLDDEKIEGMIHYEVLASKIDKKLQNK